MSKLFNELCTPAKVYFVFAVISNIFAFYQGETSFMSILINIIFVLIWTYILGWICKKGFNLVSWFLVLAPLLILPIFLIIFISKNSTSNEKTKTKE
jgi:hypothetical protein